MTLIAPVVGAVSLLAGQPPGPQPPRPAQFRPPAPSGWVAFSADLEISAPGRPAQFGRHVQDEHGCRRQETVHPDGSLMITIVNHHTQTMYRLLRGAWTAQSMRAGEHPRTPIQRPVDEKTTPVEDHDAYIVRINVKSARGSYVREATVIPALNFFEARSTRASGEILTARNIRVGPQSHDEFVPPAGATVSSVDGFGGDMTFSAVVIVVMFPGRPPVEVTTMEETAHPLVTPGERPWSLVTAVTDRETNTVRVRVVENASGRPGNVKGDVLDEIHVRLGGGGAATTKLSENFELAVTRINNRRAR